MKKTLSKCLTVLMLAAAFVYACNEDTIDPVVHGSLRGTVFASQTPVAGVEISTTPTTTTVLTNENGEFTLANIPGGEYTVSAKLEGYKTASDKALVTRNDTTILNLHLGADATALNTPAVEFPANAAENIDRSVTLKWSLDEGNNANVTFDVILFESNSQTPVLKLEDHADTTANVTDLKFNTTYFWQINAINEAGGITYGPLWHFKTRPFPDNRFVFTSRRDGNYEIYSSDETGNNLVRLTFSDNDQVYPKFSHSRTHIAYAEHTDLSYHIFIMNRDGSSPVKVTTLPIAGYHNDGRGFCWSPDNGKLLYSHYDKLYTIDRDGSNLTLIATAPAGRNFRSCDWTGFGNKIVAETVGVLPYVSEFRLIDLDDGSNVVMIGDEPGSMQSPSFSIDGNSVLFTQDFSKFESSTGRQLDSRAFVYTITSGSRTDLSKDKVAGTNDLHPRYSPDGSKIILENRSNDGTGLPALYTFDLSKSQRTKLFDNAAMPDWK